MKFYLLILLFILFVFVAIIVYCRYHFRHILYCDLDFICKHLKNNIKFNKNKIDEILTSTYSQIHKFSKKIITSKSTSFLKNKVDQNNISNFINSLGQGDVQYEINNISYHENIFGEMKNKTKESLEKDGKMYLKLIIGIGLALCIILI